MEQPQILVKKYLLLAIAGLLLFSTSCKKNDGPEPDETENTENITINEWVAENMRFYYYWNESIPADRLLDFELGPIDFFETILNPADRFSWIAKADELEEQLGGISSSSTGMKVSLIGYNCTGNNCENVLGVIRYVIPNSPSDKAGLKRGMFFSSVNGTKLTVKNYQTAFADLYDSGKGFKITIATLANNIVTETSTVFDLTSARVEEPSVYKSEVITTVGGKKVGYIFYNTFLNAKADEVFNAFNELKSAGVGDLILDLRYNLGGGISVAGVMAALIKPNYNKDEIFVNYNYNKLLNNEFDKAGESRNESFNKLFPGIVALGERPTDEQKNAAAAQIDAKVIAANLNLSKVYILATGNSASASELVIHNLAPYMEVIHIGETTVGKNEGSFTIEDEREPQIVDWAIQPIVVKLADKDGNGDYDTGLIPDSEIDEFDTLPLLPLGDKADPLVAKALSLIDPTEARSTLSRSRTMQTEKLSLPLVKEFNDGEIKARPVQMDGAIDKKILDRIKEKNK